VRHKYKIYLFILNHSAEASRGMGGGWGGGHKSTNYLLKSHKLPGRSNAKPILGTGETKQMSSGMAPFVIFSIAKAHMMMCH
jgi:hypothetical protein